MNNLLNVRIPQFEGPLDLLLYLVQKNEMDIATIHLVTITDQYLKVLEDMKERNLDVAADFLIMAAQLIFLKSKALLPSGEESVAEEIESLKRDLATRLEEYRQYQDLAQDIKALPWLHRDVFLRPVPDPEVVVQQKWMSLELTDIVKNYQTLLMRSRRTLRLVKREYKSIVQRVQELAPLLAADPQTELWSILPADPSRTEVIITFISLLELARLQFIELEQEAIGAPLRIRRIRDFESLDFSALTGFDAPAPAAPEQSKTSDHLTHNPLASAITA